MNDVDVIEGAVLGDASLRKRQNMNNAYFITNKAGMEHLDRLEQLRDALGSDCTIKPFPNKGGFHGRKPVSLWLWTKTNPELTELFYRWYPDDQKRVPANFVFSPESLASFFMDDGSSSWLPSRSNPLRVMVSFYAQGFPLEDIVRLKDAVCELNLSCRLNYGTPSSKPRLVVKENASVHRLMDIVEPYVVPSFFYKVKRPKSEGGRDEIGRIW